MYHPFNSWGTGSKWTVQLGLTEDAQAIAMCDSFVGVATSHLYVRIYSITGIQYFITSISGPVVSMAGYGNQITIVHHASSSPVGNHLKFMVIDLPSRKCIAKDDLPISHEASLRWIGYSSIGVSF
jgi:chromosome transmission fidelity protein 4